MIINILPPITKKSSCLGDIDTSTCSANYIRARNWDEYHYYKNKVSLMAIEDRIKVRQRNQDALSEILDGEGTAEEKKDAIKAFMDGENMGSRI